MSNIEIQVLGMVAVAGVTAILGAAAMCWLRERCLVAARKTRPRSPRKAVVKTAVASMMTAGAIWYGGSKGIRESGDEVGQPSIIADGDQGRPTLRSGDDLHFAAITPTNDCMLLKIALPSGGVADDALDLFSTTNLLMSWSLLGEIAVSPSTVTAEVIVASSDFPDEPFVMPASAFFAFGTHADSDEDGIYDGRERFLVRTNPHCWDSDGDGLSDGAELSDGTDPHSRDTDGDGHDDDEQMLIPAASPPAGGNTIRYYHDADGRLVGAYVGASGGASTTAWTTTGDPQIVQTR